jgi:hypothetical protein
MMQKKSLQFLVQVQEVLQSYDFALTLRQIYYQLVSRQYIPNRKESYRRLSQLCVKGRDEGILPEDAFADRLREIDKPSSWADLNDFMATVRQAYRKDVWQDQENYIEIWTEKDALRGVITPVTYAFDVSLLIVRGQVSRTAIYESYERFFAKMQEGKNCYLFYFGDFDPSGLSIYNSLVQRLRNYGEGYGNGIIFQRIALTAEQIEEYHLPQDPAKKSDPSYKSFVAEYGDNVVELDSLPPDALRELIKNCIEPKINKAVSVQVQETEKREKVMLEKLLLSRGGYKDCNI